MISSALPTTESRAATALLTGYVGGLALVVATGTDLDRRLGLGCGLAVGGGLLGTALPPRWRLLLGLAAAAALGAMRGALAAHHPGPGTVDGHLGRGPLVITGVVRESVAPTSRAGLVVDAETISAEAGDLAVSGGVLVPLPRSGTADPKPGQRVRIEAAGLRPPGRRPGPRSAAALERLGVEAIAASATVTAAAPPEVGPLGRLGALRILLVGAVDRTLSEPSATLIEGIAFGLRRPLAAEVTAPLQDAGLYHILVVSGLKVIIVAGMVRAVARERGWSRRRTGAGVTALVAGYVLLSGAGPAAVRSAAMAEVAILVGRDGRRAAPLPVLALTAAVMLSLDPHQLSDVGFQLSFLGTAGILLMADRLAARLPGPRLLTEPFAVTVAAQAVTFPVMAASFGVISLIGPVANALVLPVLPALIIAGGLGALAGLLIPALGWLPLHLAAAGCDGVLLLASLAARVPGAAIHLGSWPGVWTAAELCGLAAAAVVAIPLLAPRWRPRSGSPMGRPAVLAAALISGLLAGAVVLAAGGRPDGRLHVTVLDVGAAPSVLVRTGDGSRALIDGGADPARLLTALGRVLPGTTQSLDLVLMTGGDRGSVAGLAGLGNRYRVSRVMAPDDLAGGAQAVLADLVRNGAQRAELPAGSWRWGGARWRCFALPASIAASCVLQVGSGARALILGGASLSDQEELAGLHGEELASELLVSSPGATSSALTAAVRAGQLAQPSAAATRQPTFGARGDAATTGRDGDLEFDERGGAFIRAR